MIGYQSAFSLAGREGAMIAERTEQRELDLRSAHVVLEHSTVTCQLRELSAAGASGRLDRLVNLPPHFQVTVEFSRTT